MAFCLSPITLARVYSAIKNALNRHAPVKFRLCIYARVQPRKVRRGGQLIRVTRPRSLRRDWMAICVSIITKRKCVEFAEV